MSGRKRLHALASDDCLRLKAENLWGQLVDHLDRTGNILGDLQKDDEESSRMRALLLGVDPSTEITFLDVFTCLLQYERPHCLEKLRQPVSVLSSCFSESTTLVLKEPTLVRKKPALAQMREHLTRLVVPVLKVLSKQYLDDCSWRFGRDFVLNLCGESAITICRGRNNFTNQSMNLPSFAELRRRFYAAVESRAQRIGRRCSTRQFGFIAEDGAAWEEGGGTKSTRAGRPKLCSKGHGSSTTHPKKDPSAAKDRRGVEKAAMTRLEKRNYTGRNRTRDREKERNENTDSGSQVSASSSYADIDVLKDDADAQSLPLVEQIDLAEITARDSFHVQFNRFVEEGYLDQRALPGTTQERSESHPRVTDVWIDNSRMKRRMGPEESSVVPDINVWYKVIQEPFSTEGKKKVFELLNEVPCMQGTAGKSNAKVSVVSDLISMGGEGAHFVVGESVVMDSCSLVDPCSAKLFPIARFLMKGLNNAIEYVYGKGFDVTLDTNLVHYVMSYLRDATYNEHNDCTPLIVCHRGEKIEVMQDRYLPTPDNLIVVTMVLTNAKTDESTGLEISYRGKKIGTVPLSSGFVDYSEGDDGTIVIHIQGPNGNMVDMKHKVVVQNCIEDISGNTFRVSITFRLSICPRWNKDIYEQRLLQSVGATDINTDGIPVHSSYEHLGVIGKLQTYEQYKRTVNDELAVASGSASTIRTNVSESSTPRAFYQLTCDYYPNLSKDKFKHCNIYQPVKVAGLKGMDRLTFLTSWFMVVRLCRAGFLLEVEKTGKNGKQVVIPCLHEVTLKKEDGPVLPNPGIRLNLHQVCQDARIRHSNRAHPVIDAGDHAHNFIVILSEPYKNRPAALLKLLERLDEVSHGNLQGVDEEFLREMLEAGGLAIYLCGGSPHNPGNYSADLRSAHKDDPWIEIPAGQVFESNQNNALRQLWRHRRGFALYVREQAFCGYLKQNKLFQDSDYLKSEKYLQGIPEGVDALTFAGYARATSYNEIQLSRKAFIEEYGDKSTDFQKKSRFRRVPHGCEELELLFTDHDWEVIAKRQNRNNSEYPPFRRLRIAEEEHRDKVVGVRIPSGQENVALGATEDMVDEEYFADAFIAQGLHLQYLVGEESNTDEKEEDEEKEEIQQVMETRVVEQIVKQKTKCSMRDLTSMCILTCGASSLRFLGESLLKESVNGRSAVSSQPLMSQLAKEHLPTTLRVHPLQPANPALAANALILRDCAIDDGLPVKFGERIPFDKRSPEDLECLSRMLLRATLLRFFGRAASFYEWKKAHNQSVCVPAHNEIECFLSFLEASLNAPKSSLSKHWIASTHKDMIPPSCKDRYLVKGFIRALARSICASRLRGFFSSRRASERHHAVMWLKDILANSCVDGTAGNLRWMSQKILADIDEIFLKPFGEVMADTIIGGCGSKAGQIVLRNGGLEFESFAEYVSLAMNEYQALDSRWLNAQGYYRDEGNIIRQRLNGREQNANDFEQFPCDGVYRPVSLALATNAYARRPVLDKPQFHPLKLVALPKTTGYVNYQQCPLIKALFVSIRDSVEEIATLPKNNKWKLGIPEVTRLPGETEFLAKNGTITGIHSLEKRKPNRSGDRSSNGDLTEKVIQPKATKQRAGRCCRSKRRQRTCDGARKGSKRKRGNR